MDEFSIRRAKKLLEAGLAAVANADIVRARDRFKESAEAAPSAEAYTFWGWMEHHLGQTDLAISLCKKAIERDPDFGNPYNDIGSYLVSQGKLDEAIPWLERATEAIRYEPRQFPHLNLGRIYLAQGLPVRALAELEKARAFAPEDENLADLVTEVRNSLN